MTNNNYPVSRPTHAYNIEISKKPLDRNSKENQGWCFGLPPGIKPEQWPLDPNTGYPMAHGFTLLLPEQYRVHGSDYVALSFFAISIDHMDGRPATTTKELYKTIVSPSDQEPDNPDLLAFWDMARKSHNKLYRMKDILDCEYAVIVLTQEEFDGPLCSPPQLPKTPFQDMNKVPQWLSCGSAAAFLKESFEYCYDKQKGYDLEKLKENYLYEIFEDIPSETLEYCYPLMITPREQDPNAGKEPQEDWGDGTESGYQRNFYWENGQIEKENYREHEWVKGHKENHIGGTMRQIQAVPEEFSPFYIGFEEYLGGYNFGMGNAQLDFFNMKFDWACG